MNIIKPIKSIASASALCALIAFSGVASVSAATDEAAFDSAQQYQRGGGYGEHMQKRMIKKLALSEQQQVQIKALKTQAKEQHETLRESMKKFKTAEKTLLQAAVFDEQAYTALHSAYQSTFAQRALTRAKTRHAIFNVLTAEQQEKWVKIMEKRKEKLNRKRG